MGIEVLNAFTLQTQSNYQTVKKTHLKSLKISFKSFLKYLFKRIAFKSVINWKSPKIYNNIWKLLFPPLKYSIIF